ncbi:hypothetical protein [Ornithinimicrobium sp. Y1694]|uniref:hypothetical protein n=1 Tax=Ornithinimicrobium sp. Y1694 TaxID=3418590 RepID=UPI003CF9DB7E
MNDTKNPNGFFADPGSIAPSVDKHWRDDFIVELRLRDVDGPTIGDALMTVETHVSESGESAQDAFGDPRAYARELAPEGDPSRWPVTPLFVVANLLGLLGLFVTARAFGGWLDGGPLRITVGDVASAGVLLALMGLITAFFVQLVRVIMDHVWLVLVASFFLFGALVALPTLLLTQPLFTVSPILLGLIGVTLLSISSVLTYRDGRHDQDEIVAPGESKKNTSTAVLTALMLPFATVITLVITWIPTLFA